MAKTSNQKLGAPNATPSAWPLLVVLLAAVFTMGRVVNNDFLWWDDNVNIHHNPDMNPPTFQSVIKYWWTPSQALYIPITYSIWGILAWMARLRVADDMGIQLNPMVFHAASVLVHAATAGLVFALLCRLRIKHAAAMLGAVLFAVHPVQVETVAWAAGLKDLLCGFFSVLSLLLFVRYRETGERSKAGWLLVGAIAAFVLGMLSKPTAMVTPALAGVIDLWLLRTPVKKTALTLWPWFVLSIGCMVLTRIVQQAQVLGIPWHERPLVAGFAVSFYLYKLIWPAHLGFDYGWLPQRVLELRWIWMISAMPVLLGVTLWILRWRMPYLWVGFALFVIGMLPVAGFVPFLFQFYSTVADHYLYLPMVGVALSAAWLVSRVSSPALVGVCGVVLGVLSVRSIAQAGYWYDDVALCNHTIDISPRSAASHNNLGVLMDRRGNLLEAAKHLKMSIDLRPQSNLSRQNYVWVLARLNRIDEAIAQIEEIIRINPTLPPPLRTNMVDEHYFLAMALMNLHRYAEAIPHFEATLRLKPDHPTAAAELEIARRKLAESSATRPASTAPATQP
jgi:hypothetical protein